jgi:hypothetical protein
VYLSIGVQAVRHYSHNHSTDLAAAFCELDGAAEEDVSENNNLVLRFTINTFSNPYFFHSFLIQNVRYSSLKHATLCHGWYVSLLLDLQRFNL